MQVHARMLFTGPTVRIMDWHCLGQGPEPHGQEEWNDAAEVVVVRRGAFIRQAEGREVFVDPGTVAFYDQDQSYRVRHPLGGDACSAFRVTGDAAGLTGALQDGPTALAVRFPVASAPLEGRTFLLHRLALRAALDSNSSPLEVEELAVAFLRAAVALTNVPAGGPRGAARGPRAADYAMCAREVVARRYRERLTLSDIASDVGCSPFHLHRMVTAVIGIPLHRLVMRLRLRDALERLLETRESVSAIAYAAGFASHSHLTDSFRREYGESPRAVRRFTAGQLRSLRVRGQHLPPEMSRRVALIGSRTASSYIPDS